MTTASVGPSAERDAFEAYLLKVEQHADLQRGSFGLYWNNNVDQRWIGWQASAADTAAQLQALRDQVAALTADAARYQWLRESGWFMFEQRWLDHMPGYSEARGEAALHAVLDAAIDADRTELEQP